MPAIILTILGFAGRFFVLKGLVFVAKKALLISLVVVLLPIVLKNIIYWFMEVTYLAMQYVVPDLANMDAFTMQLWDVGAYLGNLMQLDSCLAIILSGVAIRVTLNMIQAVKP